jgi:hypothetical protein
MRHTLVLFLLIAVSDARPGRAAAAEVPHTLFALEMDGGITLPVRVNGHGPFRFRLDTGASRSAVSERLAARLALERTGQTLVVTAAGRARQSMARLDALAIGNRAALAVPAALVVAARDIDPAGRIDGLVGNDILGGLVFTIDYTRRRISWYEDAVPDPLPGTRVDFDVSDGRALVTLPQRSGTVPTLRLVPDTGADCLVLLARPGRLLPFVTPLDTVRVRGVAGARLARRVLVQNLDVGTARLGELVGLLVDGDAAGPFLGDGLLPLHLFTRVTFNGPEGYVVFDGSEK